MGMLLDCANRMQCKISVDQLTDVLARYGPNLERLEMSWGPDIVRFSDKSQKAIDTLRVRCLKMKCLVLW